MALRIVDSPYQHPHSSKQHNLYQPFYFPFTATMEIVFPSISLNLLMYSWLVLAFVALCALWFIDAPYGRRARSGWGPGVPNQLAWFLMEAVVLVSFFAVLVLADTTPTKTTLFMATLLTIHYVNRALIYPWRTKTQGKTMPLSVMLMSALFNTVNGSFLGADLLRLNRGVDWFSDPRFIIGFALFVIGMSLNWHSDNILLSLRAPGETDYKIPHGGAFRWVTSPNLLGEIVEWIGFAILTWSLAGLTFAVWTCANLIPRARSNQRWYHEHFPDYPASRRILLPGVW
ncbi:MULTISPECIES: DUF1295 domain-containing protein [unclassified Corynebacterium]|uniref:DUF1295 domain-containing protein n=1 Tax=unclassified Corynebacterium TaxID=2624378 RepID=UPI0030978937